MSPDQTPSIIPPIPIIRERLACHTLEASLLRRLLRLAMRRERELAQVQAEHQRNGDPNA